MIRTIGIAASLLAIAVLAGGCAEGVAGGTPRLPLSKGCSSRNFHAGTAEITVAITNAFRDYRYRDMALYDAARFQHMLPHQPKQGYLLEPLDLNGTTNVLLTSGVSVPYIAHFHIRISPITATETKVTVCTLSSEVLDGKEFGWHSGVAVHHRKVPPVRTEEENVLNAISDMLAMGGKSPN